MSLAESPEEKLAKARAAAEEKLKRIASDMKKEARSIARMSFLIGVMATVVCLAPLLPSASSQAVALQVGSGSDKGLMAIGMGLAVGLAALGAGIAIASAGSPTISASVEKPESFTRGFIIVTLGEALAIYGLIVSILIWISLRCVILLTYELGD
mgnify:CR=1 FL=1